MKPLAVRSRHRAALAAAACSALLLAGCAPGSGDGAGDDSSAQQSPSEQGQGGQSPTQEGSSPSSSSGSASSEASSSGDPGQASSGDVEQAVEHGYALNTEGQDLPVVTMFTDYECPACGSFHPAVVQAADELDGEVVLRVKNFPLPMHDSARPAALAVEAAAMQDAGPEYADLVYGDVDEWSELSGGELEDRFVELAGQAGLDQDRFRDDMGSEAAARIVDGHEAQAQEMGLRGTPSFVADGRSIDLGGIGSPEDLIDEFREAAEGAGSGSAPDQGTEA